MMCFHLLRPYKAPEKHPPCCSMCERVCGFVCLRASETLCLLPSMHGHGSSLEEACELWTRQNTQTRFQKTNEGSKHGRMRPPPPWLKDTPLSQRGKQALSPLLPVTVLWMSSGWKHVLYINSMKTRLGHFPSVIYWSDECLGLEVKCLWIQSWHSCQHSTQPVSKAHIEQ